MSSQPLVGSLLRRTLRVYQIWGANTDVGKTVFSTILCKLASSCRPQEGVAFLKPVSTGPLEEADDWCEQFPLPLLRCPDGSHQGLSWS